jgi:ABC-type multidrug transport system ATPase subunit
MLQDDLLYESLTVWETLWYAAQLRLPRTMSQAAKRDRVNVVLAALGLNRCRDTIIGTLLLLCFSRCITSEYLQRRRDE